MTSPHKTMKAKVSWTGDAHFIPLPNSQDDGSGNLESKDDVDLIHLRFSLVPNAGALPGWTDTWVVG